MAGLVSEIEPDRVLLDRVGAGDQRALRTLYERYAPVVLSFVTARVSNRETAEEIGADVWLGCWRSARAFRGDSQVLTWLLAIAKRQIWTHSRRQHPPALPLDDHTEQIPSAGPGPDELALDAVAVESLMNVLAALPDELTEVVTLAWLHELPYEEIASVADVPVGTVKSRVSRARRLMREALESTDV